MPTRYDPYSDQNDPERDALVNALDPSLSADPFAGEDATDGMPTRSPNDPATQFPGPSDDWGSGTTTGPDGQTGGQDAFASNGAAPPIYTQTPGSAAYQGTATTTTTGNGSIAPPPLSANINAYLNRLLTSDPYNVTLNDPGVQAASEAYRNSAERSLQSSREAMAERMNAEGTMGGGLDSWVANAYQGMGQDVAANDAQLVLGRQQQRLGQLNSALSIGAGLLTADQEQAIRMEIARMQNELGQGALNNEDARYYANLNDYLRPMLEAQINAGYFNR